MRACGQKLVKFCTHKHAAKLVHEVEILWSLEVFRFSSRALIL